MLVQPIDYFLVVWFTLAAASTLYVGIDQYRNNPEPVVMKWGFILVTLYMGPLGLLLYVLADKEPRPGEHEDFTRPLWCQSAHCRPSNRPACRPAWPDPSASARHARAPRRRGAMLSRS